MQVPMSDTQWGQTETLGFGVEKGLLECRVRTPNNPRLPEGFQQSIFRGQVGGCCRVCDQLVQNSLLMLRLQGIIIPSVQFSRSVMSDSVTPWTAARQASLFITNCQSSPKPMSIESVMPSKHLILCHLLLLPSIFPSIRVFSNESAFCIRCPKYLSFQL